jgi:hypothetical protein
MSVKIKFNSENENKARLLIKDFKKSAHILVIKPINEERAERYLNEFTRLVRNYFPDFKINIYIDDSKETRYANVLYDTVTLVLPSEIALRIFNTFFTFNDNIETKILSLLNELSESSSTAKPEELLLKKQKKGLEELKDELFDLIIQHNDSNKRVEEHTQLVLQSQEHYQNNKIEDNDDLDDWEKNDALDDNLTALNNAIVELENAHKKHNILSNSIIQKMNNISTFNSPKEIKEELYKDIYRQIITNKDKDKVSYKFFKEKFSNNILKNAFSNKIKKH